MARPQRNTVDYFPHYLPGRRMFIIESKYGIEGFAVVFRLLELLAETDYHYLDLNDEDNFIFLQSKCFNIEENKLIEIISLIAKVGIIDQDTWEYKIIWSSKFVDSVKDAYKKRVTEIPNKENIPGSFRWQKLGSKGVSGGRNSVSVGRNPVSGGRNPQSKVKERKVDDKTPPLSEILQFFNKSKNNLDRFNGETFKGLEDAICAEFEKYLKQRVLEDNPIDEWRPYFRGWVRNQNLSDIKQKYGIKTENPLKDFFK